MLQADRTDEQHCLLCQQVIDPCGSMNALLCGPGKICEDCLHKRIPCQKTIRIHGKRVYIEWMHTGEMDSWLRRGFVYHDREVLDDLVPSRTGKKRLCRFAAAFWPEACFDLQEKELFFQPWTAEQRNEKKADSQNGLKRLLHQLQNSIAGMHFSRVSLLHQNCGYQWIFISMPSCRLIELLLQDEECRGLWILSCEKPQLKDLKRRLRSFAASGFHPLQSAGNQ